jgi:Rrf2 family protein
MKLSDGIEWGMHCCTVLALLPRGTALPASRLAEFHGVPPAYLAKHLQALARAGIVQSTPGPRGGYRLSREPGAITLLEIVDAIDGGAPAFRCTEIRQRGPACVDEISAYLKPCGIARAMWKAEDAYRRSLREQTVADLIRGLATDVDPRAAVKAAAWMQEVLS